jgi:hypothetical protein
MIPLLITAVCLITYFVVGFAMLCIMSILLKNYPRCTAKDMIKYTFGLSFMLWPIVLCAFIGECSGSLIKDLHDKITSR